METNRNPKLEHDTNSNACSKPINRKPPHLRIRVSRGPNFKMVKGLLRELNLHTVCEKAGCPNIYECFESKTATFLILGDTCTRNCRFCLVDGGKPLPPDNDEPMNIARAVYYLSLKYVVITSVTRDDLGDGGASVFAKTIREIRRNSGYCGIEVLIPDFKGDNSALRVVVNARPDVLNHNIETVPRLYPHIRPAADYKRSLKLLRSAKALGLTGRTKSGIMVGLGETIKEIIEVMANLRDHGCDILTIGQYLAPSNNHFPIVKYYDPSEFDELRGRGLEMGFSHIEADPLVRSSYHAKEQYNQTE